MEQSNRILIQLKCKFHVEIVAVIMNVARINDSSVDSVVGEILAICIGYLESHTVHPRFVLCMNNCLRIVFEHWYLN